MVSVSTRAYVGAVGGEHLSLFHGLEPPTSYVNDYRAGSHLILQDRASDGIIVDALPTEI